MKSQCLYAQCIIYALCIHKALCITFPGTCKNKDYQANFFPYNKLKTNHRHGTLFAVIQVYMIVQNKRRKEDMKNKKEYKDKKKIKDMLFIINLEAGTGYEKTEVQELISVIQDRIDPCTRLCIETVSDHPAIIRLTESFIKRNTQEKVIIAGGGGGTLHAVITAIYKLKEKSHQPLPPIKIGTLRMGSGNVIAKLMGIPKDPVRGLVTLIDGLNRNTYKQVCIGRFDFTDRTDTRRTVYGATLMGFGEFGHVPGEASRFNKRFPFLHHVLSGLFGIEFLNTCEYILCLLRRGLIRFFNPHLLCRAKITSKGISFMHTIISGLIMNFPIQSIPIHPGITISDERLYLHSIPYTKRRDILYSVFKPHKLRASGFYITPSQPAEIEFTHNKATELFIDEDPYIIKDTIHVSIAGTLDFITVH
jgi:hypothetical protein